MSRGRSRSLLVLGGAQLRKRLARDRLPGGRARVRVDFEDAAVILRPFDDTFGDPALKRALRVAHRDHLRDESAAVGDVDGVTALYEVDVDAGVLPELADADPLSGQVRCRVVHGITRVPEVRIERLAASPVALLCHALTVAHDMLQSPSFPQRVATRNSNVTDPIGHDHAEF